MMKLSIFLLSILIGSFASAQSTCLDSKEVTSLMKQFEVWRWDGDTMKRASAADTCNPENSLYPVLNSLMYLKKINSTVASADANNVVLKEGPFNFFTKRIKKIVIEDFPSAGCKGTIIAYVKTRSNSNTTFICPKSFNTLNTFAQSSVLIHEARHIDGYSHVICTQGNMQNVGYSCDTNYNEQGSYGIEASFSSFMAKSSPDAIVRQQARSHAIDYFVNRFNRLPLNIKPGVAALDFSNKLTFFDGKEQFPLAQLDSDAIMTPATNSLSFHFINGKSEKYSYSSKLTESTSGFAKAFQNSSDSFRQNLLSIRFTPSAFCVLLVDRLNCGFGEESRFVDLPEQNALALVPSAIGSTDLSLLTIDGTLYEIPNKAIPGQEWDLQQFKKSKPQTVFFDYVQWTESFTKKCETTFECLKKKSTTVVVDHTYGLGGSLELLKRSSTNQWQQVQPLKGQRFKNIAPLSWSRTLENL